MTRWSTESVSDITVAATISPFGSTTGRRTPAPTARIDACGGLITASKLSTPIIPRFEIAKLPPWYSCGASLRSRARAARSFISPDSAESDFRSASRITGVNRPPSIATATATSEGFSRRIRSPAQTALQSGTSCSASADALMMKSLTESLTPRPSSWRLSSVRSASSGSSRTSRRR